MQLQASSEGLTLSSDKKPSPEGHGFSRAELRVHFKDSRFLDRIAIQKTRERRTAKQPTVDRIAAKTENRT